MSKARDAARVVLLRNTFGNLGDLAMRSSEIAALAPVATLTVLTDDAPAEADEAARVSWGESDLVLADPLATLSRRAARRVLSGRPTFLRTAADRVSTFVSSRYRGRSLAAFQAAAVAPRPGAVASKISDRAKALLDGLSHAQLVVAGGGLLASVPAVSEPRRAVLTALRSMRVPYVLHGLSLSAPWTDDTYRGAALVVVRDARTSWTRALECGVAPDRLVAAIDPAFALEPAAPDRVRAVLQRLELGPGRFIAVNLRPGRVDSLIDQLAARLPDLCARPEHPGLLLFGMQHYRQTDDGRALERLRAALPAETRPRVWASPDARLLKGVLGQAAFVVSCRYHGALFALASNVPAVGVAAAEEYDVKMRGLFDWYGLDDCCVGAEERVDECRAWPGAADPKASLVALLRARNAELGTDVASAYDRIHRLIASS